MFFPLDGISSQSDKDAFKNGTSLGLYRITVCQGHTFISDQINTEKKTITDVPRHILKNM